MWVFQSLVILLRGFACSTQKASLLQPRPQSFMALTMYALSSCATTRICEIGEVREINFIIKYLVLPFKMKKLTTDIESQKNTVPLNTFFPVSGARPFVFYSGKDTILTTPRFFLLRKDSNLKRGRLLASNAIIHKRNHWYALPSS